MKTIIAILALTSVAQAKIHLGSTVKLAAPKHYVTSLANEIPADQAALVAVQSDKPVYECVEKRLEINAKGGLGFKPVKYEVSK